jgi:hypothetical protein
VLYAPVDENVTLTQAAAVAKLASSFTVNPATKTVTVTADSTYDDLYDALKAHKCTATQANLETPAIDQQVVSHVNGGLIAATDWNLVVNTGVTLSEGTKAKKVTFTTITESGTVTGLYETTVGPSTRLNITNLV